jgi:hypothetical protein
VPRTHPLRQPTTPKNDFLVTNEIRVRLQRYQSKSSDCCPHPNFASRHSNFDLKGESKIWRKTYGGTTGQQQQQSEFNPILSKLLAAPNSGSLFAKQVLHENKPYVQLTGVDQDTLQD